MMPLLFSWENLCSLVWMTCAPSVHLNGPVRSPTSGRVSVGTFRVHGGKTHTWNAAGEFPPGVDCTAVVGRGSHDCPTHQQGIKILGTPLEVLSAKHRTFVNRIPMLEDLQCAWLLLVHCASARANYIAIVMEPPDSGGFLPEA